MTGRLRLKRAYAPADPEDGTRVLVDRLWPRGLAKAKAHIDLWLKDAAPSTELRKWFDHRADRWAEFQRRYQAELNDSGAIAPLRRILDEGDLTLLYAAANETQNNAVVLAAQLGGVAG